MPLYIVRKSDGYIYGYTEQLAKNTDKYEVVNLKKLPRSGAMDLTAYYRRMEAEKAKKTKAAKEELARLAEEAGKKSSEEEAGKKSPE